MISLSCKFNPQGALGVRFVGFDYGFWENIWTCSTDKRQETGNQLTGFSWQQEGTEREQIITDRGMEVKTIWQRVLHTPT